MVLGGCSGISGEASRVAASCREKRERTTQSKKSQSRCGAPGRCSAAGRETAGCKKAREHSVRYPEGRSTPDNTGVLLDPVPERSVTYSENCCQPGRRFTVGYQSLLVDRHVGVSRGQMRLLYLSNSIATLIDSTEREAVEHAKR